MNFGEVTIIDGGFATSVAANINEEVDGDPLWSARLNATNPDAVIKTHLNFLKHGAQVIRTNTYQATIEGFMEYLSLKEKDSKELIMESVRLAHIARNKYLKEKELQGNEPVDIPWVIGSIGPYGAYLHDGSEYTGSYANTVSKETLQHWHRKRIQTIVDAGVNALAVETIPCLLEAEAVAELLCEEFKKVKFWISFQCKDDECLASGENFAQAMTNIWNYLKEHAQPNCLAIGVNCTNPKFITPLFKSINGTLPTHQRIPLVVYPNSGELFDVNKGWLGQKDCIPLENYVPEWIELGVKFIGGCCRTSADDIARIKKSVDKYLSSNE